MSVKSPAIKMSVRLLVGAVVIIFLMRRTEMDPSALIEGRTLLGILCATALLALALLLSALRWKLVLGKQSTDLITLWRVYMVGWFFSLFLPTSIGGDAVRATAIGRAEAGAGVALSSVLVERLIGVAALAGYLLLGLAFAPRILRDVLAQTRFELPSSSALLIVGVAATTLFILLFLLRHRIHRIRTVREAVTLLASFRDDGQRLAGAFGVSLAIQAVYIIAWIFLSGIFDLPVSPVAFLVYVPFVSLAAMLPVTLSGLGVREGAWVLLLSAHGVPGATAVAFSLSYYLAGLLLGGFGGLLYGLSGLQLRKVSDWNNRHDAQINQKVLSEV